MNKRLMTIVGLSFAAGWASLAMAGETCSMASGKKDIVDTAVAAGQFKTLAAALKAADLVDTLKGKGPFTVFAPTDDAFAKLPKGNVEDLLKPENKSKLRSVLTYHVAPGKLMAKEAIKAGRTGTVNGQRVMIQKSDDKVMVGKAQVTKADVDCSNGVIHVIDAVILPSQKNIVETADGAGQFKTLLAAAQAAGLVDALSGDGPLTVFAPTDAAFARLPEGTVENLLKPENRGQLANILKFHVVPGRLFSDEVAGKGKAKSLLGQELQFSQSDSGLSANGAKIVKADIDTTNGVVHVLDRVILPN